jgi:hypothetical protein
VSIAFHEDLLNYYNRELSLTSGEGASGSMPDFQPGSGKDPVGTGGGGMDVSAYLHKEFWQCFSV